MPRLSHESTALITDLTARIKRALDAARAEGVAEGRAQALLEIRDLVGPTFPLRDASLRRALAPSSIGALVGEDTRLDPARRAAIDAGHEAVEATVPADPGAEFPRPAKPRRNPWAGLTPAERLARVNAIRVGRGLPAREA